MGQFIIGFRKKVRERATEPSANRREAETLRRELMRDELCKQQLPPHRGNGETELLASLATTGCTLASLCSGSSH